MLGAHSNIAAPPEMHFLYRISNFSDYFGDLRDDTNLMRALHEALNPPVPLLRECGFEERTLFERARRGDRSYSALLDVIMSDFAERNGKQRWSEKTPDQPASGILQLFPEAQIIHILRDPRDVVASRLETPWDDQNARELAAAWRWFTLDAIKAGRVGPAHYLQIRYEDLTSDPEAVIRLVCCFLQEEYEPAMVSSPELRAGTIASLAAPWQSRVFEPISAERQGRHRATMSRLQRASVAAVVHRELAALGYVPARGVMTAVGTLAKAAGFPARSVRFLSRSRLRRRLRTPEGRYQEARHFMEQLNNRVSASTNLPVESSTERRGIRPAASRDD